MPVEIIDLEEQPVPGVEVRFRRFMADGSRVPGPPTFTDATGKARVEGIAGRGHLFCPIIDGVQLGFPNAGKISPSEDTIFVVLAPSTFLSGTVLSKSNAPLEGVRIRLSFLGAFPGSIGRHIAHSNHAEFKATTDAQGHFSLKIPKSSIPMGLHCQLVGYRNELITELIFDRDPDPLEIAMQAIQDPDVCFGKVMSNTGEALVGAWVADGSQVVRTQAGGAFQLGQVAKNADLWIGAPGYAPRQVERPEDLQQIELVLTRDEKTIAGRVLYPSGEGAQGLQVRLQSEQPVGTHFFIYGGRKAFTSMSAEAFAYPVNGTRPSKAMAVTASDGSFLLRGLLPRDYTLEIFDFASLRRLEGLQFPAGTKNIRIDFPSRPLPLSGSVRTPNGVPLAGALVRTMVPGAEFRQGPQVRSDAEGNLHFESLARGSRVLADVRLPWVHLESIAKADGPLEIEVGPAARIRLTLDLSEGFSGRPRLPDTAYFLDAEGARVPFIVDDILFYRHNQIPISAEDSGFSIPAPMIVPTHASEIVFQDTDGSILVLPLDLQPGQELHLSE